MSVGAGAASAFAHRGIQSFAKVRNEFNDLSMALQAGSLSDAQTAVGKLAKDVEAAARPGGGAKDADGDNDGDQKKAAFAAVGGDTDALDVLA